MTLEFSLSFATGTLTNGSKLKQFEIGLKQDIKYQL